MSCSQCAQIRKELSAALLRGDMRGAGSKFHEAFRKISNDIGQKAHLGKTSLRKHKNSINPKRRDVTLDSPRC